LSACQQLLATALGRPATTRAHGPPAPAPPRPAPAPPGCSTKGVDRPWRPRRAAARCSIWASVNAGVVLQFERDRGVFAGGRLMLRGPGRMMGSAAALCRDGSWRAGLDPLSSSFQVAAARPARAASGSKASLVESDAASPWPPASADLGAGRPKLRLRPAAVDQAGEGLVDRGRAGLAGRAAIVLRRPFPPELQPATRGRRRWGGAGQE